MTTAPIQRALVGVAGSAMRAPTQSPSFKAEPKDFGRLGSLGQISAAGWAMIRAYYFDISTFDLPMTEAEFLALFGQTINVFSCGRQTATCGQQTNASCSATVTEPFLAVSIGVVAIGEFEKFTINGVSQAPNAEAAAIPAVELAQYLGVDGETYAGATVLGTGQTAATLAWGWPTHRFIEKFFQAFRLQLNVNRRMQVMDEDLHDVGSALKPPSQDGASSSRISTMPFIRAVNDVMAAKAIDARFYPANIVNARDCATTGGETTCTSICVPPPLAGVTYSHPHLTNLANRLFCFTTPLLLLPGMDLDTQFVPVQSESCFRALQDSLVYACVTPDVNVTQGDTGTPDHCAASCTFPGGSISIGLVLGGYSMAPQACLEYLNRYLPDTAAVAATSGGFGIQGSPLAALYANNPTAMQYLGAITREARYLGKLPNGDTVDLGKRVMGLLNGVPHQQ